MESLLDFERRYFRQHALDGCPNPRPLSDICRMNLFRLRHPWPDKKLLDEVRCSFAERLLRIADPNHLPSLKYQIWDQVTSLTKDNRVYRAEIEGIPMLLKLEELTRRDTDHPLHETFVGYQLNQLKSEIPFFAYMFGAFSCNSPIPNQLPCSAVQPAGNYTLYEYIQGESLESLKGKIDLREAWQIVRMVIAALKVANQRIGFVHQDIHFENILVRRLDTYYTFVIGNETFVSQYFPSIIDYARSQVRVDGKILSPNDKYLELPAGTEYDLAALIYSWILFSGDLSGEIPKDSNSGRSYLLIYDIYEKWDYGRVLTYLDNKYPPFTESVPLFTEDQAVIQDVNSEVCPPLQDFPKEVLEVYARDLEEEITRAQINIGWSLVKLFNVSALTGKRPNIWTMELFRSMIRNPPDIELQKALNEVRRSISY